MWDTILPLELWEKLNHAFFIFNSLLYEIFKGNSLEIGVTGVTLHHEVLIFHKTYMVSN